MRKICWLAAAVASTCMAQAEVPVYRDNALSLPAVIVENGTATEYYENIKLAANSDGSFRLTRADRKSLAYVDKVDVVILQSSPVQVSVKVDGNLSNPCVQLEAPVIRREGSTFTVILPQLVLQTFAACAQVLVPFSTSVALDTKGLAAGAYVVKVNDKQAKFTLP